MNQQGYKDQDVSIKEVFLTIKDYFKAVWKSKWLVIFVTGLTLFAFVLSAFLTRPVFPGELTFMINEEDGSGSSINGLLGQFGLGGPSENNLDKILQLSQSRRITQSIYFDSISVNGKDDYLANHVIDYLESEEEWGNINILFKLLYGNDPLPLKGFRFTSDEVEDYGPLEKKALKILHLKIAGTPDGGKIGIISTSQSEETGIMSITTRTHRPELSVEVSKVLYKNLSSFYIEKSINKHKATYDIVKEKSDSISNALAIAQGSLASFNDKNQGVFRSKDKLTEQRIIANVQKLMVMDAEVEKNLQIADFTLKNKTPFIEVIDEPMLPLLAERPSIVQNMIKGVLLGLILSLGFVVTRKFIRDVMKES